MAANKTVGDGSGGVDAVTMTAKVGAGVMACASGAVGEAASGEDTVAAGTAFWDFAGGEGGDAHRGGGAADASGVGGAGIAAEDAEGTGIRVGVEDAAGVVAAWAFAGGVIIVGVGVGDAGDTSGPETMPNACSKRRFTGVKVLVEGDELGQDEVELGRDGRKIGVEAGHGRRCLGSGL